MDTFDGKEHLLNNHLNSVFIHNFKTLKHCLHAYSKSYNHLKNVPGKVIAGKQKILKYLLTFNFHEVGTEFA